MTPVEYRAKLHADIANQIVTSIEAGVLPWRQPWVASKNTGFPTNFITGKRYRGVNPMILWLASTKSGYQSKFWGTPNQWISIGGNFKGQTTTPVVFYKPFVVKEKDANGNLILENGKPKQKKIFMLRGYRILNAEQIQPPSIQFLEKFSEKELMALATRIHLRDRNKLVGKKLMEAIHQKVAKTINALLPKQTHETSMYNFKPAEDLIKKSGVIIKYGNAANYSPDGYPNSDFITIPDKSKFDHLGHYYETIFHEISHWSEKRVGFHANKREMGIYAFYELVAEISACYLCVELGVPFTNEMLPQAASYLKGWLDQIKQDPKFLFQASTKSSRIVDFLFGDSYEEEKDEETNAA